MPPSLSRSVLIVIAPYGEICLLEWTLLISKQEPLLTQKGQATEIQTFKATPSLLKLNFQLMSHGFKGWCQEGNENIQGRLC